MSGRILLASILVLLAAAPASATVGSWVTADNVQVRLVAAAPAPARGRHGAREIPPRFDFSASVNARDAAVDFPAPERDDDGYAASNVYRDRVVLPLRLTVPAPSEPVRLDVALDIGVCEEICIPVNLRARVELSADIGDHAGASMIEMARAAVPGPGLPGQFELLSLKRVGGPDSKPEFEAVYNAVEPDEAQLFVETPGDWFANPPKPVAAADGKPAFRFAVDRKTAAGEIAGTELRLTLTEGKAATTRRFTLDGDGAKP
jgi:DsbC/DsbD-like thiol-disulfide interchange protein